MSTLYIFADEAGCLTFDRKHNVSKFFILCTVAMANCDIGTTLLALRRHLVWEGAQLGDYFHASTDQQEVRDKVFAALAPYNFRIQITVMEKSKAQPQLRSSHTRFYQYSWFYHFRYGIAPKINPGVDTLVTAASLGQKKERAAFRDGIEDVMGQLLPAGRWRTDFWPAGSDPCLQVADYCAWAVQRKFERNDSRSYDLIKDKISYSYDLFGKGSTHYY